MSSGELFGWSVGKTLRSGHQNGGIQCERRVENDFGFSVSFRADVMWVSVLVLFLLGKRSISLTVKYEL